MIDIYKTWIRDFGIDGFRIDTMKHVNDEFWQQFGPGILRLRAASRASDDFFMFGEVVSTARERAELHVALHDARRRCRPCSTSRSRTRPATSPREQRQRPTRCATSSSTTTGTPTPTPTSTSCRPSSATTTWAGSAASSRRTTPARPTPSCCARDQLAHELMYFSRGNPVVYYGDEQGFTGRRRRPGRAAGHVRQPGRRTTTRRRPASAPTRRTAQDNFDTGAPAVPQISDARRADRGATRRCATAPSSTATPPTARRLRVLADGPHAAARVRRRAQQQRAARRRRRSRPTSPNAHLPAGLRRPAPRRLQHRRRPRG